MQPVNLFDLAAQQARWLAVRQATIAGNIANVNTAGYGAAEVEPFEKVLENTGVAMRRTQPMHIGGGASEAGFAVKRDDTRASVMPSKNTVVLEQELMKAGEVRRAFEMNTAVVKSFHRMMLLATKS